MDLGELLKLTIDEQRYWLVEHQKRTAFFSGVVAASVTATVAGVMKASEIVHWAALLTGPILILSLSSLGVATSRLFYRQYTECVAVRAKIEQRLGLTRHEPLAPVSEEPALPAPYWATEPLVPVRYLEMRSAAPSSEAFVESQMRAGYHARVQLFFQIFIHVGWISLALIAFALLRVASRGVP